MRFGVWGEMTTLLAMIAAAPLLKDLKYKTMRIEALDMIWLQHGLEP